MPSLLEICAHHFWFEAEFSCDLAGLEAIEGPSENLPLPGRQEPHKAKNLMLFLPVRDVPIGKKHGPLLDDFGWMLDPRYLAYQRT